MKDDIPFKYLELAKERGLVYTGYHLPYLRQNIEFAKLLRQNLTRSEKRILGFLESRQLNFRPQHPIDYYIVDFYFPDVQLVLEIDGEQHYTSEGKEYDELRDVVLRTYGLRILRIRNEELDANFTAVCSRILMYIDNPQLP